MRKALLFLVPMLFVLKSSLQAQTQFWSDNFEDSGAPSSGTRTPTNNGGNATSYFKRTDGTDITYFFAGTLPPYSSWQGSKFWAGKDYDNPSGLNTTVEQQIEWTGINIAGKTGLSFTGAFAAQNDPSTQPWENTDHMIVEYAIDGGSYQNLISFQSNLGATKKLALDANFDGLGDGALLSKVFQDFSQSIPGTGNTMKIRVRTFTNDAAEELAFDNFRLTETPSCTPPVVSNPPNRTICANANTTFGVTATGATTYKWQVNTGSGYNDVPNTAPYSGVSGNTLTITGATSAMNGYIYRCIAINGTATCADTSDAGGTLTVSTISTASGSQVNLKCNGVCDGKATVIPSGGISPYTYQWTLGAGSTAAVTNLCANSYTVTVTDSIGCTASRTYNITQAPAFVVTKDSANVSCNGGSNGFATVTVSGGTGSYTYQWAPSGGTAATAPNLAANVYTVTIKDDSLCQTTRTFNIAQPAALTATKDSANVSCNGGSNGSATVTVSGGTAPYSYSWSPSGGTAASATGLAAGTYTVTITDNKNCQISRTFNITQPAALTATKDSANVSCNGGSNGSATVTVSGGTTPYSYSWSPSGGTAASATGLAAGTYTVTVTDNHNCQISRAFNITQPTALAATKDSFNVSCNGGSNGMAHVTVSGGTTPYSYSWAPSGGTAAAATGLTAGTYTVTVTDNRGCQLTRTFNLTQPTAMSATKDSANVSCNGGSNGMAQVAVSGGVTPYSYSWSPSGGTAAAATGLAAGTYTVTVTDGNTCQISRSFNIAQPSAVQVAASADVNICAGETTTLISLAVGGTAPYAYQWQPGSVSGSTLDATPDTTTRYVVTVTDAHSCIGRDTVVVSVSANMAQTLANGNSTPGTESSDNNQTAGGTATYYNGACGLIAALQPTGNPLGTVTATVTVEASVPTYNGRPYVARWYRISPQNNNPALVTLYFKQSDFDQYNTYALANGYPLLPQNPTDQAGMDTLVITKASTGDLGTPGAVTSLIHPTSVSWNATREYWEVTFNTPSFSQFFVHANNILGTPLPVIYGTFEAVKDKATALIRWTTMSERNNAGFTIERSNDGKQFDAIGQQVSKAADGNSNTALSYQFNDRMPLNGLNYYRLLQQDKDGKRTYSDVRMLDFAGAPVFSCYPNPADNLLKLEHSATEAVTLQYRILDMMGKVVLQGRLDVQRGFNRHDLDLSSLTQGMYHVVISDDGSTLFRTRFVKK